MARILVIDDDDSLLQMMSLMLRRAGHDPLLANNGEEGIRLARSEQPDMAIVDVMMPNVSGYDVCRTLREDPSTMDIPLMILTALAGDNYDEQAMQAGADDYLTKPVTRSDLQFNVQRLLETGAVNQPTPLEEEETPHTLEPTVWPHLVAVMGISSGVGATTLAINLSLGCMQLGRACVVDLHGEEGHVAAHLQIAPAKSWHDLTHVTPSTDKRDIGSALTIHKSGVAVLASPTHQASEQLSEETLHVVYSVLGEGFKRAVVDLPPDFSNPMTLATLPQAGNVIAVVGDNPAALGTASAKLAALEELNLQGDIHVVINRTRPHGVTHEDVTTTLQRPVAADIPYEAEQVNAMMQGTPLLMAQPNSLFSRAILYLARQL